MSGRFVIDQVSVAILEEGSAVCPALLCTISRFVRLNAISFDRPNMSRVLLV